MSGLSHWNITSLAIDQEDFVYAGTGGSSVFRSTGPTTDVDVDAVQVPTSFALHQNYPNPFNPETTISFDLLEAGFVELKIFTLLGQEVAALVDGEVSPGSHEVSFDASSLASGVYLYRLTAGSFVETRKMVLMR
jgi:hypothetical protein